MFFRVKSVGSYQYLQIVHSVRQGEKVRQQVFGTLGRLDELKASGRLEALIRSGLRHCENFAVIDAHAAGGTEPVTVLRIVPDLVFGRLWKECGIQEVIQSLLEARRYDFDVERAVYLTVLHRFFARGSDRAAERWREDYLIPGTEALELHHLYRAMAFLGQEIESKGPKTLGTPRCLKDLIEEELFEHRRDLFTEVDLVFFDTTSLYFEGRGGESIGKRGHNKDHPARSLPDGRRHGPGRRGPTDLLRNVAGQHSRCQNSHTGSQAHERTLPVARDHGGGRSWNGQSSDVGS